MDTVTCRPGPKISTGYLRGRRSLSGGKDKKSSVGGDKRLSASSRDRRASADVLERRSQGGVGRWESSDDKRLSFGAVTGEGKTKQETKKASAVDTPRVSQEIMSDDDIQKDIEELQEGLLTLRVMLTDLQDMRDMRARTRGVRGVALGVADFATSLSRDQVVWVPFVSSSLIVLFLCQLVRLFFR